MYTESVTCAFELDPESDRTRDGAGNSEWALETGWSSDISYRFSQRMAVLAWGCVLVWGNGVFCLVLFGGTQLPVCNLLSDDS